MWWVFEQCRTTAVNYSHVQVPEGRVKYHWLHCCSVPTWGDQCSYEQICLAFLQSGTLCMLNEISFWVCACWISCFWIKKMLLFLTTRFFIWLLLFVFVINLCVDLIYWKCQCSEAIKHWILFPKGAMSYCWSKMWLQSIRAARCNNQHSLHMVWVEQEMPSVLRRTAWRLHCHHIANSTGPETALEASSLPMAVRSWYQWTELTGWNAFWYHCGTVRNVWFC